jgi:hypothetical protein
MLDPLPDDLGGSAPCDAIGFYRLSYHCSGSDERSLLSGYAIEDLCLCSKPDIRFHLDSSLCIGPLFFDGDIDGVKMISSSTDKINVCGNNRLIANRDIRDFDSMYQVVYSERNISSDLNISVLATDYGITIYHGPVPYDYSLVNATFGVKNYIFVKYYIVPNVDFVTMANYQISTPDNTFSTGAYKTRVDEFSGHQP